LLDNGRWIKLAKDSLCAGGVEGVGDDAKWMVSVTIRVCKSTR
jgi:hypothetical protein